MQTVLQYDLVTFGTRVVMVVIVAAYKWAQASFKWETMWAQLFQ